MEHVNAPAAWTVDQLNNKLGWVFTLDERAGRDLTDTVRGSAVSDRSLFDYRRDEFDLGSAGPMIAAALKDVRDGTGFAILRGLPRAALSEAEFQLLTWAIGLHSGVARPQGKASHFISRRYAMSARRVPQQRRARLFLKRRPRLPYRRRRCRAAHLL